MLPQALFRPADLVVALVLVFMPRSDLGRSTNPQTRTFMNKTSSSYKKYIDMLLFGERLRRTVQKDWRLLEVWIAVIQSIL